MKLEYEIVRSDRRTLSLQIKKDGSLLVRAPKRLAVGDIERFVSEKSAWIEKHLQRICNDGTAPPFTGEELRSLAKEAKSCLTPKVQVMAREIGVSVGRITVKCQKTRWGSCSSKGNLNFNCLLVLCPQDVVDYVIVHELCHRREMNHSKAFWIEVEKLCPTYKTQRAWLKTEGAKLIARIR